MIDIQERTLGFGVRIVKFCLGLYKKYEFKILLNQLIRSGTSVGANMEEADGAVSKKDFINKVSVAYKESREALYWMKIFKKADLLHNDKNLEVLSDLLKEGEEIRKILGAILKKAKNN